MSMEVLHTKVEVTLKGCVEMMKNLPADFHRPVNIQQRMYDPRGSIPQE